MHWSDKPETQRWGQVSLWVKNQKELRQTQGSQLFRDSVADPLGVSEFQNHMSSNGFNILLHEVPE